MAIKVPILSEWNPKGLDKAKADFQKLEKTSEKVGFAMKKAFLPATAALGALTTAAGASLKAAVEDAAQQEELARQIQAVTGATDEAVAANEEFIAQMELATSTSDAVLRPALGNLVRATGDVTEAQDLLGIALDISAATGKDLNTVSEALAKAYQGETSSLKRLDPSLTAVIKSGADFNEIGEKLAETFGGAAADAADTAEGRFKRMQIQIDNAQESIGYALLPILEKLIPVLESAATFVGDNTELFIGLGAAIAAVSAIVIAYNAALKVKAVVTGVATVAQKLFNKAMKASPIFTIATIIALVVVALIKLNKRFGLLEKIMMAVNYVMDKVSDAVSWLAGKFIDFINTLIDVANKIPFVSIDKLTNTFEEQAKVVTDELTPAIEGYGEAELEVAKDIADAAYEQSLANIEYETAKKVMDELHPSIEDIEAAIAKTNKDMEAHHEVQKFISDMNRDLIDEFDLLFTTFDNEKAVNDFTDALAEAAGITAEFGEDSREAAEANQQVYRELANVIEQLGNIPATTQAQMLLDIERGELDRVMQDIAVFQHMADTAVTMLTSSEIAAAAGMVSGGNFAPSTLAQPVSSVQIGGTRSADKAGANITVNAGVGDPGAIGQTVVESITAYERRNGAGWRSS